jgi:hypothetical protein
MGVMDGTYSMVFDTTLASTYNPAFVTANGGRWQRPKQRSSPA